jgi:hypothetical protein
LKWVLQIFENQKYFRGDMMKDIIYIAAFFAVFAMPLDAGLFVDVETGSVFIGKNDVRIPANYGTSFSLTGVMGNNPWYFIRARAGWTINDQHSIFVLAASLQIDYKGASSRYMLFRTGFFCPMLPLLQLLSLTHTDSPTGTISLEMILSSSESALRGISAMRLCGLTAWGKKPPGLT